MGAKGVLHVLVPLAVAGAASFILYLKTEVVLAETREANAKVTGKDANDAADEAGAAAIAAVDDATAAVRAAADDVARV